MADAPDKQERDTPADTGGQRRPGFLDNLAQRSTGLQGSSRAPASSAEQQERRQLVRLAGIGIQIAGTLGLFLWMGHWLDTVLGWHYAAMLTLGALALIGNFYLLIKEALSLNKKP